jgi:hypothetical protein
VVNGATWWMGRRGEWGDVVDGATWWMGRRGGWGAVVREPPFGAF